MDYNLASALQEYLNTNEKLLWIGNPKRGIVFRTADIFFIPFSLLWFGFSIFWIITAAHASIFFAMFGIPFVLIGLIFVFGRFIIDAKERENTIYGLTDDRVIIKSGVFKKSIKSLNIRTLSDIEYSEKRDGSGTINIGPRNPMIIWPHGMNWWPGYKETPSLELIQDVRNVYNKILEIQRAR